MFDFHIMYEDYYMKTTTKEDILGKAGLNIVNCVQSKSINYMKLIRPPSPSETRTIERPTAGTRSNMKEQKENIRKKRTVS